jgi:signal transduction histidine kinase
MRYIAFCIWLLLSIDCVAQQYTYIDTIANAKDAITALHTTIAEVPNAPELYYLLAKKMRLLPMHDSTIYYCNKAITLLTKNSNDSLLLQCIHIKGTAQYYLDDKLNAETNWRQALQLAIQQKNNNEIAGLASNIGAICLEEINLHNRSKNAFKIADSFFTIAYTSLQSSDSLSTNQGFLTQRLMATSLQNQQKHDSANFYYKQIIALSKNSSPSAYIGSILFYATSLSQIGQHRQAQQVIVEATSILSDSTADSKIKAAVLTEYSKILYASGNYKLAYQLNDSALTIIHNDYRNINTNAYAESESKFRNQLLQYQVQLEKQKKTRLYFWIIGLLLASVLVILWLRYRNHKKIVLEKIKQKQIAIDAFIEGEEKEKARIGRELHDGIAQEIIGVKLAMMQQKMPLSAIEDLNRISIDIRNIAHELMPQTLKEYGLQIAIEDICQKILMPSGIQYELHVELINSRLPHKIEITLYRIFQELAHNIIKHSKATEVIVQLRTMQQHILLIVEDNGTGISQNNKSGIGITNLKSRVKLLDGSIQYESIDNEGTTAIIRVPI